MTSPAFNPDPPRACEPSIGGQRGFTLIEMLVVIGIIALLIALLVPAISYARKRAVRARVQADLHTISVALDAYKERFGDFPRADNPSFADRTVGPLGAEITIPGETDYGAALLCRALIGPGRKNPLGAAPGAFDGYDGNDGPGFRTRREPGPNDLMWTDDDVVVGEVFGPFLDPTKFKYGASPLAPWSSDQNPVLLDAYGGPILYYPARPAQPNIAVAPGFAGPDNASLFNYTDNATDEIFGHEGDSATVRQAMFMWMLGDANQDGAITDAEKAQTTGPFLLWSAGADVRFGPTKYDSSATPVTFQMNRQDVDDVTNFMEQ